MRTTLAERGGHLAADSPYSLIADREKRIYNTQIAGHVLHGSEVLHLSPSYQIRYKYTDFRL